MAGEYPELAASQTDAKEHLQICHGGDLSTFGEVYGTFRKVSECQLGRGPLRTIQAI